MTAGKLWVIDDAATRFCTSEMRAHHGYWDAELCLWVFASEQDAANALSVLYRKTRATLAQREAITAMLADGTGQVAWGIDRLPAAWVSQLDRQEASRLIGQGTEARRVLGRHPLEDQPEPVADQHFDMAAFERGIEAARARKRLASA